MCVIILVIIAASYNTSSVCVCVCNLWLDGKIHYVIARRGDTQMTSKVEMTKKFARPCVCRRLRRHFRNESER